MFIFLCPHLLWLKTAALTFSESFANGIRTKWQKTEEQKERFPELESRGSVFIHKVGLESGLATPQRGCLCFPQHSSNSAFCKRGKCTKCLEHPDVLLVIKLHNNPAVWVSIPILQLRKQAQRHLELSRLWSWDLNRFLPWMVLLPSSCSASDPSNQSIFLLFCDLQREGCNSLCLSFLVHQIVTSSSHTLEHKRKF